MNLPQDIIQKLMELGYSHIPDSSIHLDTVLDWLETTHRIHVWFHPPEKLNKEWEIIIGEYVSDEMMNLSKLTGQSKSEVLKLGIDKALDIVKEKEIYKNEWQD